MYYDYLCKFESEEQAKSVLYRKEGVVLDEEGNITDVGYDVPNYDMIDLIGAIYKPTGEVDEEGNPVMADVGGYHVNVRNFSEAPELSAYTVTPTNQYRKWAGDK
jgi:hypothetical protein